MLGTDDPLRDAWRAERAERKWRKSRPRCFACGEPLDETCLWGLNGEMYCLECREAWAEDSLPFARGLVQVE